LPVNSEAISNQQFHPGEEFAPLPHARRPRRLLRPHWGSRDKRHRPCSNRTKRRKSAAVQIGQKGLFYGNLCERHQPSSIRKRRRFLRFRDECSTAGSDRIDRKDGQPGPYECEAYESLGIEWLTEDQHREQKLEARRQILQESQRR